MLKKALSAALLVTLAQALAPGSQRGETWQKFNSPGGKFSVLLPVEPELKTQGAGKSASHQFIARGDDGATFTVAYFDLQPAPQDAAGVSTHLDRMGGLFLKNSKGEVLYDRRLRLYGHPGRELAVKEALQAGRPGGDRTELVIRVRTFLAGGRIYLLTAAGEPKDPASRAAAKFFTSFVLTK